MTHTMNLWHDPFEKIVSGQKSVEMRLYDEKRQKIHAGDTIIFTDVDTGQTVACKVVNMRTFATFDKLYLHYDKTAIGYDKNEQANPKDMLAYYTQAQIDAYGVAAIEIKVLS
ncbi:MAG: ASCH domain-containing protein [Clostridia bacterium]|nr:ASCH domain-containing protein [Clostridia bacterium]